MKRTTVSDVLAWLDEQEFSGTQPRPEVRRRRARLVEQLNLSPITRMRVEAAELQGEHSAWRG